MSDLIARDDVLEIIKRTSGDYATAFCNVRDLPTINPEDLGPKGRWVNGTCSNCGQVDFSKPNFCPNCGAKMGK